MSWAREMSERNSAHKFLTLACSSAFEIIGLATLEEVSKKTVACISKKITKQIEGEFLKHYARYKHLLSTNESFQKLKGFNKVE